MAVGITSVIVVNWNGGKHLEECVRSIEAQTIADQTELIVVDNGSTDGSFRRLAAGGRSYLPIQNMTNLGFAAACNQGVRASRGEFIALINNDAVADAQWLEELLKGMRSSGAIGSCASKVLSYFDHSVIDNVGHVVFRDGLTRGRGRLERDSGQFERMEEVFCASGCAALYRRRMLGEIGLFDEAFFAYCEDADLGFRARLAGWTCVYVPRAIVYHKYSVSTSAYSRMKAFHVERNRIWLAVKNLPLPLLVASPIHTARRLFWQAWGALRHRGAAGQFARSQSRGALVGILMSAYFHGVVGLPRAFRERRWIQSRRSTSTRQVREWLKQFGVSARAIGLME